MSLTTSAAGRRPGPVLPRHRPPPGIAPGLRRRTGTPPTLPPAPGIEGTGDAALCLHRPQPRPRRPAAPRQQHDGFRPACKTAENPDQRRRQRLARGQAGQSGQHCGQLFGTQRGQVILVGKISKEGAFRRFCPRHRIGSQSGQTDLGHDRPPRRDQPFPRLRRACQRPATLPRDGVHLLRRGGTQHRRRPYPQAGRRRKP